MRCIQGITTTATTNTTTSNLTVTTCSRTNNRSVAATRRDILLLVPRHMSKKRILYHYNWTLILLISVLILAIQPPNNNRRSQSLVVLSLRWFPLTAHPSVVTSTTRRRRSCSHFSCSNFSSRRRISFTQRLYDIPLRSTSRSDYSSYASDGSTVDNNYNNNDNNKDNSNRNNDEHEEEWNAVVAAFQMYKAAYGDLKVPSRFVVPAMPPWPKEAWNMKLGVRVASIRSTGRYVEDHPDRRRWLEDMGFLWRLRAQRKSTTTTSSSNNGGIDGTSSSTSTATAIAAPFRSPTGTSSVLYLMDGITFDQVYSALATYKDLYCTSTTTSTTTTTTTTTDCLNAIPNSFTVPNVEPWPEITRGMPLGKKLPVIQSKAYWGSIPGAKEALLKLGLHLDGYTAAAAAAVSATTTAGIPNTTTTTTTTSSSASSAHSPTIPPTATTTIPSSTATTTTTAATASSTISTATTSSSANDLRYQKVYRALEIYKQIYGDLLVPQPFVVPTDDNEGRWPPELAGLRLGARVNAIRSQGTFVHSQPQRKQELDALGFVWENPIEGNQKKRGRKRKEPLPPLPDTILNSYFQPQKSDTPSFNDDDDDVDVDEDLLSTFDTTTTTTTTTSKMRVNTVFEDDTSSISSSSSEDRNVRDSWAKSIDSWREQQLQQQQQQQEQQQKLDFFSSLEYGSTPSTLATTVAGSSIYSNTQQSIVNSVGSASGGGGEGDSDNANLLANLIRREPEPETMQERSISAALRAGIISNHPSSYGSIQPRRLSQSWYFDDYGDGFTFQDVAEALRIWGEYHNSTFAIPDTLVIQSREQMEYDERNRGLRVPQEEEEDEEEDDELWGDDFDDNFLIGSSNRMERNNMKVPADATSTAAAAATATLPATTPIDKPNLNTYVDWPTHLVGMELGSIVRRIREGDVEVKTVPEKKAMLDAIHFDWGNEELFLDIPFEKTMCALFAYFQIRGDLFVYDDFIMPVDEPWPRVLQGFELGKVVFQLREKQRFLETHYPEKKAMLDFLEFVWFPKYQSKLTDFEIEHYKWFNYTQPERDTLDYLFPNAEDYWEDDNPPIFNFTKAKEYLDSLRDVSFLDDLDLEEDIEVEGKEEVKKVEDVEEEEYDDDEDDFEEEDDLDEGVLDAYEAALEGEEEVLVEAASTRKRASSKKNEQEDDEDDFEDRDEDEEIVNEGDDLEIEGVEGIDLGDEEEEDDDDEEFDLNLSGQGESSLPFMEEPDLGLMEESGF